MAARLPSTTQSDRIRLCPSLACDNRHTSPRARSDRRRNRRKRHRNRRLEWQHVSLQPLRAIVFAFVRLWRVTIATHRHALDLIAGATAENGIGIEGLNGSTSPFNHSERSYSPLSVFGV